MAELAFYGAARTVTGSKYLLTVGEETTLVDAGLFQGLRKLRELNWKAPPFRPHELSQVLLTHTHLDHVGYLPRLVKHGFRGPVYTTDATADLARILLMDSARIQEEDADYANRKGYSRHKPAEPLYSVSDAKQSLKLFEPVEYDSWLDVGRNLRARYHGAGHILGSAFIETEIDTGDEVTRVLFSGDIGRYDSPLHPDPEPIVDCDVLIMESTYGDRDHDPTSFAEQLADPVAETFDDNGVVLIPAFALGRSQQITLVLRELMKSGRIPEVPIHIDSPMAVEATRTYSRHLDEEHVDEELTGRSRLFPDNVQLHRSVVQSKELNNLSGPRIIVSASGMLVGGRVLHHLRRLLPGEKNLILLVGYQAAGTRGRQLLEGSPTLRIHGADIPVRAETLSLHGLSGHGDRSELLRWMKSGPASPRQVYLTHGEPEASSALATRIRRELGWRTHIPHLGDVVEL